MKKTLIIALLALASASIVTHASAQSAQFVFTPTSSTSVAPGQNITFSISLNFTSGGNISDLFGTTYYLQQNGASPFVFTLNSRDLSGSIFNDPTTTTLTANQALNPANAQDLGGSDTTGQPSASNPGYFIANISLKLGNSAVVGNTYTIQSTTSGPKTSVLSDSGAHTLAIQPGSITITVVPEPSTYMCLAVGAAMLFVVLRRRVVS